jgi:hypothetical protein
MSVMLSEFDIHPKEKALIGEMIMAYGEIEFALVALIGLFFDMDFDRAVRILFRVNGEGPRLAVADAILLKPLKDKGFEDRWNLEYGAVKKCKSIRNQYAHCHWYKKDPKDPASPLRFMNLDSDASTRDLEEVTINFATVDLELLEKQHRYFDYALTLLYVLESHFRVSKGLESIRDLTAPKSIDAPPLSSRKASPAKPSGDGTS